MSHTRLIYHVVFRTYNSDRSIVETHEKELYNHIYSFCKSTGCLLYRIGGMPDHIHILVEIPPTISIATFVQRVKLSSGNFIKWNKLLFPQFRGWGKGYFAASYCKEEVPRIYNYIKNQKTHHKSQILKTEIKSLLNNSGIKYDEKYILEE